ncbi:hypothetical protein RJZ56_001209 [Blastomyces dermatitidis]|uniref:Apc13 domain-containing protein n=2 Tax=Ajellomyces dermatitidis TaxID=5039 RepID=F2TCP4_AJEDA|nr:uncharacterized protein BDCG_05082 [Blastomyces dermatitidis ER-3]EEQ89962.1 hypothetical protein BDCG_05082 [Blastomyces dermatitidis ER-3]EGE81007.1 Apc13 domain-containing protein [Blastomyces dermatitidis ATCC 18188]
MIQNQSKDSSPNHIHFHHPRLADLFEDFNRPYTSIFPSNTGAGAGASSSNPATNTASTIINNPSTNPSSTTPATINSFLPVEDIYVAPQHQPVNPEDEDDVVPDQHAVFGITRAMDSRREVVWRDLALEELMRGARLAERSRGAGIIVGAGGGVGGAGSGGIRRGGLVVSGVGGVGVGGSGGARRVMCLR